ncbi:MAG: type III-B CRISPR module RAMP protein Cmr4 [Spartobacteria bacterium]|nr:type III-B CRISPR module RAMP protein Cmr4 [Spartobacteria bacterium]
MNTSLLILFTRTSMHVGAGNSVGVVDSPIMRERHTRFPLIPGSSLKGVLAALWKDELERTEKDGKTTSKRVKESTVYKLFGSDDANNAACGSLVIGEGRILAFPVRSAKGCFAWITCPLALERYQRDSGTAVDMEAIRPLCNIREGRMPCLAGDAVMLDKSVVLEEYALECIGSSKVIGESLKPLCSDPVWQEVSSRLVIVSDEIFSYFVEQCCEVVTRIRINDDTGTVDSGALFNQEQVPSESLFYATIADTKGENAFADLQSKLSDPAVQQVIQIGGDASIGLGYCSVEVK